MHGTKGNAAYLLITMTVVILVLVPRYAFAVQDYSVYSGHKIYHCGKYEGSAVYSGTPCSGTRASPQVAASPGYEPPSQQARQRITLNFHAVKIGDVLSLISKVAGYKLQIEDQRLASTKADMRYINIPWDQVLSDLATKYDFRVSFDKGSLVITTPDDVAYDALVDRLEHEYPQIDPDSPNFNESVIDAVRKQMAVYHQQYPNTSDVAALNYAYKLVLPSDTESPNINATSNRSQGDASRYILHTLGKMVPAFILGVVVVCLIWLGVAFARRKRRSGA